MNYIGQNPSRELSLRGRFISLTQFALVAHEASLEWLQINLYPNERKVQFVEFAYDGSWQRCRGGERYSEVIRFLTSYEMTEMVNWNCDSEQCVIDHCGYFYLDERVGRKKGFSVIAQSKALNTESIKTIEMLFTKWK